jgi:tRNA dimethylallyltransferase
MEVQVLSWAQMKTQKKIIVIVGPTAVGKSDYAVKLAKKINGEIISADSRQVYKGLNIGSGKITEKEMKGIPHYLLDVADPKKVFTVDDFAKEANKSIETIFSKNKVPVIVGGTGFYIDALVNGIVLPKVPPNKKLRTTLSKLPTATLFKKLQKLDGARAKTIDKNNPVRLIRAIEIATTIGKVPKIEKVPLPYKVEWIGLTTSRDILRERIEKRLTKRIKEGMLTEINSLHTKGLSWKRMEELGLEYRYGALYLQKKLTKNEFEKVLSEKIYQYAMRQYTWFKKNKEIKWTEMKK